MKDERDSRRPVNEEDGAAGTLGAATLDALRGGDRAVQERVLAQFEPWLKLLARCQMETRLKRKFDPADVIQQALLEAFRSFGKFRGSTEAELAGWLRSILANVLSHEVRRYRGAMKRDFGKEVSLEQSLAQTSRRLGDLLAAGGSSPSGVVARREQTVILAEALAELPDDHREVIVLRNIEDLPHEEVARRMGRSSGAVRMLWVRALAELRKALRRPK